VVTEECEWINQPFTSDVDIRGSRNDGFWRTLLKKAATEAVSLLG
jgi:hypothetical protein